MTARAMTPLMIAGVLVLASAEAFAQPPGRLRDQPPLPQGQRIDARDGDVIVVEDDARVRIVRRRHAVVRAIYDAANHWLVVLADYASANGGPDGRVDRAVLQGRGLTTGRASYR